MPTSLASINGGYRCDGIPVIQNFIEADSQSFTEGMPVILSSNKIALAVASGSDLDTDATATTPLAGIALRTSRNTTNPGQTDASTSPRIYDMPVLMFTATTLIRLPLWAASGSDAQYQDAAQGLTCVLRNVSGTFVANIGNTTKPVLRLISKEPKVSMTEQYWWGLFEVIAAARVMS